jgi:DNA-binding transcriptional LysR family regulator
VRESAEQMEAAAVEWAASATPQTASSGTVRLATTESLAEAFVLPALSRLRAKHPSLNVTVSTAWTRVDLRRGEAHLAVRLAKPTDPRLAFRRLGDFHIRLYASRAYLAGRGKPETLEGHALIAYEEAVERDGKNPGLHPFNGLAFAPEQVALSSNSHGVLVQGALRGLGIVQMPSYVGDAHRDLRAVLSNADRPYSVWLVVPQSNRRLSSVRAVIDAVVKAFQSPAPWGRR